MASRPVLVGPRGGTVHQLHASQGELFRVCFEGTCHYCDSLPASVLQLNQLERATRREAA
jgi:Fe-S cluster biogenesis protein NfuA